MKTILVNAIIFYQKFLSFDSGLLAFFAPNGACKYEISCSEYTKRAIINEGILKGLYKGIRRIVSCR